MDLSRILVIGGPSGTKRPNYSRLGVVRIPSDYPSIIRGVVPPGQECPRSYADFNFVIFWPDERTMQPPAMSG